MANETPHEKPGDWWFVGHAALGLLSGIACYLIWRKRNNTEAKRHLRLSFGILVTVSLVAGVFAASSEYYSTSYLPGIYDADGDGEFTVFDCIAGGFAAMDSDEAASYLAYMAEMDYPDGVTTIETDTYVHPGVWLEYISTGFPGLVDENGNCGEYFYEYARGSNPLDQVISGTLSGAFG